MKTITAGTSIAETSDDKTSTANLLSPVRSWMKMNVPAPVKRT